MSKACFCFWISFIAAIPFAADSAFFANSLASGFSLGQYLPHNPELAFKAYRKAARQGDASAAYALGSMYYSGVGIKESPQAAAYWWRQGAEDGYVLAQSAVGDAYCMGIGVYADRGEARHWWLLAEQQGDQHAAEMLRGSDCIRHPLGKRSRLQLST